MAESYFSQTILDNSGESSKFQVRVLELTSGNFATWVSDMADLGSAIGGIINGTQATERRILDKLFLSRTRPASTDAQREKKWLVVYEDSTTHKLYRSELPCADLSLLTSGSDRIVSFPTGPLADFKTAWEAFVKSPDGNAVTLSYIEFVGKRL